METFKPVEIKKYYINRIANGMKKYFFDNIFKNIFEIIKSDSLIYNSKESLINAIKSYKIYYENGAFRTYTRFSNDVSKTLEDLGAVFKHNAYYIDSSKIPLEIKQFLSLASNQALYKLSAIKTFLSSIDNKKINLDSYIEAATVEMFKSLEKDIVKSAIDKRVPVVELGIVKPKIDIPKIKAKNIEKYWKEQDKKAKELKEAIEKAEKLNKSTDSLKDELQKLNKDAYLNAPDLYIEFDNLELNEQSKTIAKDYIYNMQYWVKKWEAKNIILMRQDVLGMVEKGARVPEIEKYFLKRWKIAGNKANFLAKNESHLASSVIIKTQYEKLGCNRFKWGKSTSKERRLLHKKYYGKIFYFDDPPIIDEKLAIKGLPRQIWNCNCQMLVVVPTLSELQARRKIVKNEKSFIGKIKNAIISKERTNNINGYRRFDDKGQTL